MSYDLYFHKRKGSDLTREEFGYYLNEYVCANANDNKQWFAENGDTETYFTIDYNEPNSGDDEEAPFYPENLEFEGFENTRYSLRLNFLRADFFGRFAFMYVDRMIEALDLYVYNPQLDGEDRLIRPAKNELYEDWARLNRKNSTQSIQGGNLYGLIPCPAVKLDYFYSYNLNRASWQEDLKEKYFVPKLYLMQRQTDGQAVTVCIWSKSLPVVLPQADYYILYKTYRKLLKSVNEMCIVASDTFYNRFGHLMSDLGALDCKIILPDNAAKKLFNDTPEEFDRQFIQQISINKIVNANSDEIAPAYNES